MRLASCVLGVGIVLFGIHSDRAAATEPAKNSKPRSVSLSTADRLVEQALTAELNGDNARRDELVAQALKEDPNCRAARWQLGYVKIEGKWLNPEEVGRRYSTDRTLAEYRKRRDEAAAAGAFNRGTVANAVGGTVGGPMASHGASIQNYRTSALSPEAIAANAGLARWCRTKRLAEEERTHWTQVLLNDFGNREARTRLGLHPFAGGLYTSPEIESIKRQMVESQNHFAVWKPVVTRWRTALDDKNEAGSHSRTEALTEMKMTTDPAVIPALEWASTTESTKSSAGCDAATPFQREAVSLIGRLPDQRATYSLTLHAVLAKEGEVRRAAADELKKRPLHDFVPVLLAELKNPIVFRYAISYDERQGVAGYDSEVTMNGQNETVQIASSNTVSGLTPTFATAEWLSDVCGKSYDNRAIFLSMPSTDAMSVAAKWTSQANSLSESVKQWNDQHEQTNQRIEAALERITGQSTPTSVQSDQDSDDPIPDPKSDSTTSTADYWWTWWSNYNEVSSPNKPLKLIELSQYKTGPRSQPVKIAESSRYVGPAKSNSHSCFSAGTTVVSLAGPIAIEKLSIGDRVLSQDPTTGEVAYKPVLATSKTPSAKLLRVSTSRGSVRLTRGHPFWIVGKGWRMAKELSVGDQIHGVLGSAVVTAIEEQPEETVYNLNVADFGTYFVSDAQLLVHDFSVRLPNRALLPGYVADEANAAAR